MNTLPVGAATHVKEYLNPFGGNSGAVRLRQRHGLAQTTVIQFLK